MFILNPTAVWQYTAMDDPRVSWANVRTEPGALAASNRTAESSCACRAANYADIDYHTILRSVLRFNTSAYTGKTIYSAILRVAATTLLKASRVRVVAPTLLADLSDTANYAAIIDEPTDGGTLPAAAIGAWSELDVIALFEASPTFDLAILNNPYDYAATEPPAETNQQNGFFSAHAGYVPQLVLTFRAPRGITLLRLLGVI